ncbi:hypothetical protein CAPTEDRAFT_185240 [Capitella teleta]|uniref:Uncharacterized protein n=1 Tax=Capitella teleta TaxID=283909 RepID=R7TJE9_CAPTE|nr:hypothetical protein CAPTEDRAFT_185240 [Capitella teleta]|eukprot:ELT93943.1 hypothetical protein CAPTEDRAFT_185240 [Capitella teleta]
MTFTIWYPLGDLELCYRHSTLTEESTFSLSMRVLEGCGTKPKRRLAVGLTIDVIVLNVCFAYASTGWCKRTFYFVITILAIGAWAYHTYAILTDYLKFDSSLDVEIVHAPKLEFPAVTVCNQNAIRKINYYDPEGLADNEDYELSTEMDRRVKVRNKIDVEVSDINDDAALYELGHQLEDFVVDCEYNQYECYNGTYTSFYNWQYGNCFTFNNKGNTLLSTNTGPIYGQSTICRNEIVIACVILGFRLTFNIEQDEYVGDLTSKAGVRVMVHPKTTMPFPENNGVDVAPGVATAIGIRKVNIQWLGGRYGECVSPAISHTDINVYESLYPSTAYTREACDNTCFQQQMISICGCADSRYPDQGLAIGSANAAVVSCDPSNEAQADCAYDVEAQFRNGSLACSSCKKSCREEYYIRTISSSVWPSNSYKAELELELENSPDLKKIKDDGTISQNLGLLEIYYEDLNYENMVEIPAYDDTQFMADFGGAIGLWLGASMITVFEFLEYFLDLWLVCCCGCGRRSRGQSKGQRGQPRKKVDAVNSPSPVKRPLTAAAHKKHEQTPHNTNSDPVVLVYPTPDSRPRYGDPVNPYQEPSPHHSPQMAARPRSNRASRLRPKKAVNPTNIPRNHGYGPERHFMRPMNEYSTSDYFAPAYDAYDGF